MPVATPVTTPVAGSTVATAGKLLIHVPPAVASVKVTLPVAHTDVGPDIMAGSGLTVTTMLLRQPPAIMYEIVVVPGETPVAMPEALPIGATVAVLLAHVPPAVGSESVMDNPSHILEGPEIEPTVETTVTIIVDEQVVPIEV